MTESSRDKTLEVMARALHEEDRNGFGIVHWEALDANELAWYFDCAEAALTAYESHLQAEGMAVVPEEPTPSPSATELALAEAVGHISLLTAFWMETPGWTHAAEAAREFIGGVPIDWKAERPEASVERSVANSTPVVKERDDE